MIEMYRDQFEEFKACAKRGSVDSYLIGIQRHQSERVRSKRMSDLYVTASAPGSREGTPVGSCRAEPHHSRSHSFKYRKPKHRPTDLALEDEIRPRTSSMPTSKKPAFLSPPPSALWHSNHGTDDDHPLYRVRSFKTTTKGIVNRGDSFKSRSTNSVASTGSFGSIGHLCNSLDDCRNTSSHASVNSHGSTTNSVASSVGNQVYKVFIMGSSGVGKTALTQQFMTSEYMGAFDTSTDEEAEKTVSVLLDGEESTMDIYDLPTSRDPSDLGDADAYVVVYDITSRSSFDNAVDILFNIRKQQCRQVALILVGNKSDLVRSRQISEDEGKEIAISYNCKFIQTSAVLNHQVDDLLVGVLSQIRLAPKREELKRMKRNKNKNENGSQKGSAKKLLSKIFRKDSISKSCDNLLVL
ncbi:GTP-binding protein RAD-like isoform X2 [Lineus longissimus]|uniref:GTP-binding protein RAD-like isoform X2 n=1 Tax=Lineus longissimus TaxID=88925 RepID=UPI002B4F06DB